MADREIAIVGAGAVGVTVAHDLARKGVEVRLYERGEVAGGASGRAAGIVYDAFTTETDAELGRIALERFQRFSNEGAPFEPCPYVWMAADDASQEQIQSLRDGIERMQTLGIEAEEIEPVALADRFPCFRTDDIVVAGITESAGHTDPGEYTAWLADRATEAGATFETNTPVELATDPVRVHPDGNPAQTFDAVLVAAGASTKRLLDAAGLPIAMKPYRVQALVASVEEESPIWYDVTADCYARPHPSGMLAGDGTEEREADPNGYDRDADDSFVESLSERISHRLPECSLDVERAWAGVCTATPDRDPLVGELADGLYVATGFQGQGFMRSPAVGRRLADQLLGGAGIETFDPTRFDGDEEFAVHEGMSIE